MILKAPCKGTLAVCICLFLSPPPQKNQFFNLNTFWSLIQLRFRSQWEWVDYYHWIHSGMLFWRIINFFSKGLFTWRWGTPGRWGNPPSRGRKIKRVYMQSYNPGVLGWGFLRLLLRLQLRSLSRGVPNSHLEKHERLILGHFWIFLWKRHALCCAVFGFARNRWLNTLYGIVWETKYGRFTTLNIPKCEPFTLLLCPLRFLVTSAMTRLGNVQSFKTYMFCFWAFCHERDPG